MGLPLENLSGYNNSKLTAKAGDLRNVQYLLAHGGADGMFLLNFVTFF